LLLQICALWTGVSQNKVLQSAQVCQKGWPQVHSLPHLHHLHYPMLHQVVPTLALWIVHLWTSLRQVPLTQEEQTLQEIHHQEAAQVSPPSVPYYPSPQGATLLLLCIPILTWARIEHTIVKSK